MRSVWSLGVMLLLTACASQATPPADLSGQQAAILLVLEIANAYKPGFQPTNLEVALVPQGFTAGPVGFGVDPLAGYRYPVPRLRHDPGQRSTFALLRPVAPGAYQLRDVRGSAVAFPTSGAFTIPVEASITVRAGRVTYLGHVQAVNRERRSDQERRAGPVMPFIDQGVSGFSGGTFDLTIRAAQADDLALLAMTTPISLERIDVQLVTLSP